MKQVNLDGIEPRRLAHILALSVLELWIEKNPLLEVYNHSELNLANRVAVAKEFDLLISELRRHASP